MHNIPLEIESRGAKTSNKSRIGDAISNKNHKSNNLKVFKSEKMDKKIEKIHGSQKK